MPKIDKKNGVPFCQNDGKPRHITVIHRVSAAQPEVSWYKTAIRLECPREGLLSQISDKNLSILAYE